MHGPTVSLRWLLLVGCLCALAASPAQGEMGKAGSVAIPVLEKRLAIEKDGSVRYELQLALDELPR